MVMMDGEWNSSDERIARVSVAPDGTAPAAPFTSYGCPSCCTNQRCAFLVGRGAGTVEITSSVRFYDGSQVKLHKAIRVGVGP